MFGEPSTWSALAFAPVAATPRESQVYAMGDKSPKSKDKTKKQSTVKKADDKAKHDKKQASAFPSGKGG